MWQSTLRQPKRSGAKIITTDTKGYVYLKQGDKVLLRNLKRADRKGGKSTLPWIGPYTVEETYGNGTCTLKGGKGVIKAKQNMCNLKLYVEVEVRK